MKFELDVIYNNGDTGETDSQVVNFDASDEKTELLAAICSGRATNETLGQLFKHLYDNPNMDGTDAGVAYETVWGIMSRWAFDELGWHDVTVDVVGLKVDGQEYPFDPDMVDFQEWSLQLSREGFMYCYS